VKSLEGLARTLFTKFSIRETGKTSNWDYLSDERKLAWMQDVATIASYIIKEIKSNFKPLPNGTPSMTVYDSGHLAGIRAERILNENIICDIEEDLVDDLENSKYNN